MVLGAARTDQVAVRAGCYAEDRADIDIRQYGRKLAAQDDKRKAQPRYRQADSSMPI